MLCAFSAWLGLLHHRPQVSHYYSDAWPKEFSQKLWSVCVCVCAYIWMEKSFFSMSVLTSTSLTQVGRMTRDSQRSSSLPLSSTESINICHKDKMLFSICLDCSWTGVHLTRRHSTCQGVNEFTSLSELRAPLYGLIPQSFLPRHNALLSVHCCFIMPSLVDFTLL